MLHKRLPPILIATILAISICGCSGHRILGIFPLNIRSHMMMFEQLMKGLARRGHQVDVISIFPQRKPFPNYTDITIPSPPRQLVNNMSYDYVQLFKRSYNLIHSISIELGYDVCEKGFSHPAFQQLIKNPPNDPPYDLVIIEIFGANCFMIFGHHLKIPMIGVTSAPPFPWTNDFVANPQNHAFVSNNLIELMEMMYFSNRLYNVIHSVYSKLYFNYLTAMQDNIIKNHFGPASPSIRELEQDLALTLVNTHMSLNGMKPITPAFVEVGGLHIQDDDIEIPKGHKEWLDESKNGFIYFTFGSMITIESFPRSLLENMYKSFRNIAPVRVFMKVPHPEMLPPGLPNNVRTFVWVPQLKVLKHKNIRAFITHGGLMGTQEAVACAVPMIGLPLFFDQFMNIDLYVSKKIAVRVDYHDLTTESFDAALNEVLHNPMYRKMAKEVSEKFLDRPLSPMDEACYWVEYVIKHGAKSLHSPALNFSWWQIDLLDVYAFLIITIMAVIFILFIFFRFMIDILRRSSAEIVPIKKLN